MKKQFLRYWNKATKDSDLWVMGNKQGKSCECFSFRLERVFKPWQREGKCRWSVIPWGEEIELRIQWGQGRRRLDFVGYSTREEKAALRENLGDLQRVYLESSQQRTNHCRNMRKLLKPGKRTIQKDEREQWLALTQDWEEWLFPIARLENIIHGILGRVFRKISPQKWEVISCRLSSVSHLPNKSQNQTQKGQTVSKQINCIPKQSWRVFLGIQKHPAPQKVKVPWVQRSRKT